MHGLPKGAQEQNPDPRSRWGGTFLFYFIIDLLLPQAQHFKSIDYSCDHCGKVYKTRDSFKKHVAVHKRNPEFYGRGAYNSSRGSEREYIVGQEGLTEDRASQEELVQADNALALEASAYFKDSWMGKLFL